MNILFAHPYICNPFKGGIERVTDVIAKELKRRGHNIFYLHIAKDESRLHYDFPAKVSFLSEQNDDDKSRAKEYVDFLEANEIDIVINQGGVMRPCNFFCETGDSKSVCITVIHSNPTLEYYSLFEVIRTLRDDSIKEKFRRILRILYYPIKKRKHWQYLTGHYSELASKCDHIVLLSNRFKPEFRAIVPDIDERKLKSIGNPNTFEVKYSDVKKEKMVIFVGRMDRASKNPGALIDIWKRTTKRFPDWQLVMIRGGEALEAMKQKARNIPNITFTGFTDPTPYYQRASILCMTSNYEGWGMVLTEAMSYGVVPMAFSSYASVHELLREPIQKVEPFRKKEYAKKLSQLMTDETLRANLVEKGYKIADEYSTEHIVDIWENYFKQLMNNP